MGKYIRTFKNQKRKCEKDGNFLRIEIIGYNIDGRIYADICFKNKVQCRQENCKNCIKEIKAKIVPKKKQNYDEGARGPTWRDREDTRIANKRTHADRMNSYNHGFGYEDS